MAEKEENKQVNLFESSLETGFSKPNIRHFSFRRTNTKNFNTYK